MNAQISPTASRLLEKLLTGAVLTLTLSLVAQGFGHPAHSQEVAKRAKSVDKVANAPLAAQMPIQDGTYLYGQSSRANQMGSAYMVFEIKKGNVVGGFYMPRSSFDCFKGSVQGDRLALNIRNSYEQTTYPYSVALQQSTTSASLTQSAVPVGLQGFYPLQKLGTADQRILSTCKAALK